MQLIRLVLAGSFELEYFINGSRYVTNYRSFAQQINNALVDSLVLYLQAYRQEEYNRFAHSVETG